MQIKSSAFENQQEIPVAYTCDGENISPPLEISDVPENAASLVLMVDDPDAPPQFKNFTHWIVWNISPDTTEILENDVPQEAEEGLNDNGELGYTGPCPPSGEHHYRFRLFAIDRTLTLTDEAKRGDLEDQLKDGVLEVAELVGSYKRGDENNFI